jgi:hypothetical protein
MSSVRQQNVALADVAKQHYPERWFERSVYPRCSCGYDPKDNGLLYEHWAEFGISWYCDTRLGQFKWRAAAHTLHETEESADE